MQYSKNFIGCACFLPSVIFYISRATFDDSKAEEAVKKRHSTISEAVGVAEKMQARRLILTHFSQRYQSTPPMPAFTSLKPILAYDFMRLPFKDLLWAHELYHVLCIAFPAVSGEEDADDSADSLLTASSLCDCSIRDFSIPAAVSKGESKMARRGDQVGQGYPKRKYLSKTDSSICQTISKTSSIDDDIIIS